MSFSFQLKIKDIHIRYEDGLSCPGKTFACGVRVESLTAQTCDDNWMPKFMSSSGQGIMYKVLELQGLAVYWDTNTDLYCSDDGNASFAVSGRETRVPIGSSQRLCTLKTKL